MTLGRRAFLKLASNGPFVFGLADLHAFPQEGEAPSWWRRALDRMKELGRPGLVFIAPDFDAGRDKLGFALRDLLESEHPAVAELLCSAVAICLRPEAARTLLGDVAEPGRTIVLDPSGRVIEKCDLAQDMLRHERFEEHFAKLIHGKDDARLSAAADRVREKLTDGEKTALADLEAEAVAVRERASRTLEKRADSLMPLLVSERRTSKDPEKAERLRQIINSRFRAADEKAPGPRLPFGTQYEPGWS